VVVRTPVALHIGRREGWTVDRRKITRAGAGIPSDASFVEAGIAACAGPERHQLSKSLKGLMKCDR
jgi:hypothetical protein